MNFTHNFVTPVQLQRVNINGKRHYALPNGEAFKSVTTVISENTDKTFLEDWKKRVGETEAAKISTQAANRGTAVHKLAEGYILNKADYTLGAMPTNLQTFAGLRSVLDKRINNVKGVELPLYSRALRTAGCTDLVADYDGVNSVIDFKTSRKLKKEEWIQNYFIQSTVYAMMFEWIYKIPTPQIVVIITVDHEDEPQVFVKEKQLYVETVINMFRRE